MRNLKEIIKRTFNFENFVPIKKNETVTERIEGREAFKALRRQPHQQPQRDFWNLYIRWYIDFYVNILFKKRNQWRTFLKKDEKPSN